MITPCYTVLRRHHSIKGKPAKWFLVGSVLKLKEANLLVNQDMEDWLAGESTAKPCAPERMTL